MIPTALQTRKRLLADGDCIHRAMVPGRPAAPAAPAASTREAAISCATCAASPSTASRVAESASTEYRSNAPKVEPSRVRSGTEATDRNGVRLVSAAVNIGQVPPSEEASATTVVP